MGWLALVLTTLSVATISVANSRFAAGCGFTVGFIGNIAWMIAVPVPELVASSCIMGVFNSYGAARNFTQS